MTDWKSPWGNFSQHRSLKLWISGSENKKTETDKTETNQEEQSNVAEQTKDEEHQENKEKVKSEN